MSIKPVISVIIPVYNLENQIAKTLDSVCQQTYNNLQIIIINDGSKDGSLGVCRSYAQKDERIILIDKNNEGLPLARQTGLKIAQGEYIHHLDGGDFIDTNAYDLLVKELNDRCFPDVLLFGFYYTKSKNTSKSSPYPKIVTSSKEFLRHIWTTQQYNAVWQYVHKRELADQIKFDSRVTIGEDAYYTSQLLYSVKSFAIMDANLLYYIIDDGTSMTRNAYSEKGITSLLLYPQLIDRFMSDTPDYKTFKMELLALKLQSYATLIIGGYRKEMDRMVDDFMVAFDEYPDLKNSGEIKRVRKLVALYNKNKFLYRLMLIYYKSKGKVR